MRIIGHVNKTPKLNNTLGNNRFEYVHKTTIPISDQATNQKPAAMSEAKLISECFVRPHIEVEESKRIHHLNPFDLRLLSTNNSHLGYLFAKPSSFSPSSYLERLRYSLSQALVYFYPLAGRLVTSQNQAEGSSCIYVDCKKGPGARLVYASSLDLTMVQVLTTDSDDLKVVLSLFDLGEITVNYDGHTRPLLSVQVTKLQDGVFLGICLNHSIVDGVSAFHFQRIWSHIFCRTLSPSIPLSLVKQPSFFEGRIFKFSCLDLNDFIIRSTMEPQCQEFIFEFSPNSLKKLKAMANSDKSSKTVISTFLALSAFVWKCITRVRNLPPDTLTTCAMPIDLRPRFKPPLSNTYFGNFAVKTRVRVKVNDLLDNNICWAATLLKRGLAALDDTAAHALVLRALKDGPEIVPPTQTLGSSDVMVGGYTRFDLNESNFGLGRLVGFRSGYGNKGEGKVNAYMGSKGDGGVDLHICLPSHTMTSLLSDQEFMSFASINNGHFSPISRM